MKKIIALILAMIMIIGTTSVFAQGFTDISGHWGEAEILAAEEKNIVNGDGTGAFRPDDNISRAEFIKMLSALLGTKMGVSEIPDEYATDSNWYSKYYNFATLTYLAPDTENAVGNIHPGVFENSNASNAINRWEMAYAAGSFLETMLGRKATTTLNFTDTAAINALPGSIPKFVTICTENGIIKGDTTGAFNPMGTGTRAEAVVIVARIDSFVDALIKEQNEKQEAAYNQAVADLEAKRITYSESEIPKNNVKVKFTMEDGKNFTVELYPKYAPQTVANFVKLVNDGFYNGLTFHRIVDGFVAQGGDPNGDGSGGSEHTIYGEFSSNGFTQNTLKHTEGVISMARSQIPNSASCQFFICLDDAEFLDGEYAAFGKVIRGMDTVKAFTEVERTTNSIGELAQPVKPIIIKNASVVK